MSSAVYDAIVVGMGIHGSSSLAHLAMKGASVLGIEQFSNSPSHNMGSSHGESRIIRKAYFEDPAYVPLLERAFGLWQELELLTNNKLLYMTGGLMIGKPDSEVISGTLTSAKEHALRHTVFTADEIRSRFPSFSPSEGEIGVFENEAGYLLAEACVSCYQTLARANGASIEFNLKMNGYEVIENEASKEPLIRVFTNKGIYTTKKLILAVGSWASEVYGEDLLSSGIELTVERRVSFWIQPKEEDIEVFRSLPIYIWDSNSRDPESYSFYGFPLLAGKESEGAKIALHFPSSTAPSDSAETPTICTPGNLLREVTAKDEQLLRKAIRSRLPSLDGTILRTSVCSYTVTKNHHLYGPF